MEGPLVLSRAIRALSWVRNPRTEVSIARGPLLVQAYNLIPNGSAKRADARSGSASSRSASTSASPQAKGAGFKP